MFVAERVSIRLHQKRRKTSTGTNQTEKKKNTLALTGVNRKDHGDTGAQKHFCVHVPATRARGRKMNKRERERHLVIRNRLEMSDQGDGDGELRSSGTPSPRRFLTTVKSDQAVCVDEMDYIVVMELL